MPAVKPFHTSLYLTLAVAILAIGVAGGDLLPELPFVTAFSLLLLGVAFYLEGRWELSLRAANFMGLGLGAFLGLWAIFQVVRPPTGLSETLPWPANALPYLAPVLMILIPAKLLRSKHMGDYWAMHGLGLLAIGLACAMAMDGVFILLFMLYAVLFVWSLISFHVYRELGAVQGSTVVLNGGRWSGSRPSLLWATLCGALAVPLFWATPRSGSQWELALNTRGKTTTGLTDGPVDLNRTGPIAINSEKAFNFYASTPEGTPILDFSPDQRFRALARNNYQNGTWDRNKSVFHTADRAYSPPGVTSNPQSLMPDFGPGTIQLSFVLTPRLMQTPPLANPVAWEGGMLSPAVSRINQGVYRSWVHRNDGTVDGAITSDSDKPSYVQAWIPPPRPGYGPVMRVQPFRTQYLRQIPRGLPKLRIYTDGIIERLVAQSVLPKDVLTDVDLDTRARLPQHHEAIARALEQYLSRSGDYSYSLDLKRSQKDIDPIEDFLLNTRSGHCQRFATALVLMLRTQGIPSQLVVGYRGCESQGDGWYEVREDNAHAWAEVLLPASNEGLMPVWYISQSLDGWWPYILGQMMVGGSLSSSAIELPPDWQPMRWVTFDPTPSTDGPEVATATSMLDRLHEKWEAVLKTLLLAYNADSREQASAALKAWLFEAGGLFYLLAFVLAIAGVLFIRRLRTNRSAYLFGYPDYVRRMAGILARIGIEWKRGETAREYAIDASEKLSATPELAKVPIQIVEAYYAERFGGQPLDPESRQAIATGLSQLTAIARPA